jgi:hypothetical protein
VCKHPERARIELMRAGGVTIDILAKRFSVHRDAIWRHYKNHVSDKQKAYLLAGPVKLEELAELVKAEQLSLIDYLKILRSTYMAMFQAAAERGEAHNVSALGGRLLQVLGTMGRLTGELALAMPGSTTNVTNNTLVISSPAFARVQSAILLALAPYPEARDAVIGALRDLDEAERAATPALPPPIPAEAFFTKDAKHMELNDAL